MTPRLARLLFTYEYAANRNEQNSAHPIYRFHFDFAEMEAEHLLASLSVADTPPLLSRRYQVRLSVEPVKSLIYESLQRRAQQVLGTRHLTAPGYDPYVEWRRDQLGLFRELLARIEPAPGRGARTIERLLRRVDGEEMGLRTGRVETCLSTLARCGSGDLMDEMMYAIRANWEVAGDLSGLVLAVDRRLYAASGAVFSALS